MNPKLFGITLSSAVLAMALVGGSTSTAAAPQAASATEEVCVSKAVEDKVTTCPGGFKMGAFNATPRSRVGTGEKKEEVKPKAKGPSGPSFTQAEVQAVIESSFKKKREKKKIDILKKEIDLIKRLAEQTPNDNPEKAEILKRLADAYQDFYQQLNFMARDLDEKIFQTKKDNPKEAAKLKAQQKALDKKGQDYRELSIKAYVEIRNGFPDYAAYDEILFAIAYEIDQLANEFGEDEKDKKSKYRDRAREFYQELIRNFPRSKFIPHAWMAFGQFYFDEAKDVERAMKAYEKVVEWGEQDNPNYVIAMYYQAWCMFNLQDYKTTINQFNKVIKYAEENPEHREAQAVAKRARMEMVDPFSKIGNPSQAWEFFQKVGADLSHKMLIKLANVFFDEGRWADAIIVYHKLEELEIQNYAKNNGDELCEYQIQVTNAVINSQPKDAQLTEMARLMQLYVKFSADSKHDKKKVDTCAARTIAMAVDQATHWHVEAVGSESAPGTNDKGTMKVALGLYDEILKTFPNIDDLTIEGYNADTKPTRYRLAYYKAELAWKMEDWPVCAQSFDAVVEMDPAGQYTSDAAYAAVLCYNKVYMSQQREEKKRTFQLKADDGSGDKSEKKCDEECQKCRKACKGKDKQACLSDCDSKRVVLAPKELSEVEAGMLKSYDRYVCFVTDGQDLVNIKYRRARIYYEANQFAEAAVLFRDIAVNHSDNELGVYAANLYLDCLNAMGSMIEKPIPACYDDLSSIVDLFIDETKAPGVNLMKDAEFAGQIKALKVGVLRKKAESLTARKRFKESAEIYLTIFQDYSGVYDDTRMCEVLFNSAINLESARLVGQAIKIREKMIELYPTCEHSKKAAYYIGQNYHALAFYSQAAENYERFATKYAGEKEGPEALGNAVMFYIGLGLYDEAKRALDLYEKNYRTRYPAETASVVFGYGYIFVNDKNWDMVRKHYNSYLKVYGKTKLIDEEVQAWVFIGDSYWNYKKPAYVEAEKAYRKAIDLFAGGAAMEKVSDNKRKAAMLIAAAKAMYHVAERKFQEFKGIKFPEFVAEKEVPKKVDKWWREKQGPEKIKEAEEIWKYRRIAMRWGEIPREDVKKEERKEISDIQFQHWLEFKFKPWMESKSKVLTDATNLYGDVAKLHVPEWEMAAAARAGDMQLEFMQSLYDAPIPPSIKDDQELVDIYRGAMDEKAEPFRNNATGAYEHCLNISTKVRWFNENSLRCEKELNKLDPRKFPVSEEIRTEARNELKLWAVPEPILELETEAQKRDRELTTSADKLGGAAAEAKGE